MTNFLNKQSAGKLLTDVQESAKFMGDMELFFRTQWKKEHDASATVQEYEGIESSTEVDNQAVIQAYINKNGLIDPQKYAFGSRIRWNTPGMLVLEIAFNEFDLTILYDEDFDVFNQDHIESRWQTLFLQCKTLTGVSMDRLLKTYALQRGLTYTEKKRGRKAKQ